MEACVRGFAFMPPDNKVMEVMDLQYIEGGELERTWKTTRRQRLKEQEQKIWDEFVKEQDVVKSVFNDDPYQFLEQMPENCLKELMESELEKMQKERRVEEKLILQHAQQEGSGDSPRCDLSSPPHHACTVTFADQVQVQMQPDLQEHHHEDNEEDCDNNVFHIFDDDRDDEPDYSGTENEGLTSSPSPSPSPCTVRENNDDDEPHPLEATPSKSSENVSHIIESSIYCAKVKDMRLKINEEMLAIIDSLERQDLSLLEMEEVARAKRRSAEFCNRFNRIYLYQLQRQVHDVTRNYKVTLPFAKHTQFQSQMVRIVSLHQNMLQALQVFHKWFSQGGGGGEAARACVRAVREQAAACALVPPPDDLAAARGLYHDIVLETCDKLDEAIDVYTTRTNDFFNSMENVKKISKTSIKSKGKKRPIGIWSKNNSKSNSETEARLSMYSLDTLRLNLHSHSKTATSKNNQSSGMSKMLLNVNDDGAAGVDKTESPKSHRKSPRCRRGRPLMRAPGGGGAGARGGAGGVGVRGGAGRRARPERDRDVRTMVESVQLCASTYISREGSPQRAEQSVTHRDKPRGAPAAPPAARAAPPAPAARAAPAAPAGRAAPAAPAAPAALAGAAPPDVRTTPRKPQTRSPLVKPRTPSPLLKPRTQSPKLKRWNSPKPIRPHLSYVQSDYQDSVATSIVQLAPVSKILCAKKEVNDKAGDVGNVGVAGNVDEVGNVGETGNFSGTSDVGGTGNVDGTGNVGGVGSAGGVGSGETSFKSPRSEREKFKVPNMAPANCEVTRLLRQLCGGDACGNKNERIFGAKNAQLLCMNGGSSPRQPSTPQLLRILEETIQKKVPKQLFQKTHSPNRDADKLRLTFNIPEKTASNLFQYRTKFVQHMLTSPMYANSVVGKPWEMIGSISEQLIDELLLGCAKEMELQHVIKELYNSETH